MKTVLLLALMSISAFAAETAILVEEARELSVKSDSSRLYNTVSVMNGSASIRSAKFATDQGTQNAMTKFQFLISYAAENHLPILVSTVLSEKCGLSLARIEDVAPEKIKIEKQRIGLTISIDGLGVVACHNDHTNYDDYLETIALAKAQGNPISIDVSGENRDQNVFYIKGNFELKVDHANLDRITFRQVDGSGLANNRVELYYNGNLVGRIVQNVRFGDLDKYVSYFNSTIRQAQEKHSGVHINLIKREIPLRLKIL